MSASPKVRIGIAGAPRGRAFLAGLSSFEGAVELAAVYDPQPEALKILPNAEELMLTDSFERLLEDVDAVIIASPQQHHAPQAITALERGVHVLSEVPAAVSLEQASALVGAVRSTSAKYMMAENYCYTRANLTVRELARNGAFGSMYFGEGEYLHEMKSAHRGPTGAATWRYYWQVGRAGVTYPTHSLGPLLQWCSDRVVAVSCIGTGRHTDPEHEIDDTVLLLARTARGALLKIRLDLLSNRPHLWDYYSLQGTRGCYEAPRVPGSLGFVYFEGKSPEATFEPLENYVDAVLPSRYRDVARNAGHWGADTWPVREFLDAVMMDTEPPIDVYAALDMTLPGIVSESSFYQNGAWLAVPNPRFMTSGILSGPGREAPLA